MTRSHMTARTVVTIGNFDGVHRGHQALLRCAAEAAASDSLQIVALTFEPHPATWFRSMDPGTFRVTSSDERARLLMHYGADTVLTLPFDQELAELQARDFVHDVLVQRLRAAHVVVGWDFTFGHHRQGTTDVLRELGAEWDFGVRVLAPQLDESNALPYSSTRVRNHLRNGEMAAMRELCGHSFSITGMTRAGAGRGRGVGIPTVNLYPEGRLLPVHGVYATRIHAAGQWFDSISNLGVRPTFEDSRVVSLETMILQDIGDRDLHDIPVQVELLEFIRPEKQFADPESLRAQISADVGVARQAHVAVTVHAPLLV